MMDEKDWIYRQSGVVPYRYEQDELKLLLITSRHRKRWIFPKGIVDYGFSPQESAENEAYEEAGIEGKIDPFQIGQYQFLKWGGEVTVQVFLFEVTQEHEVWPESSFRRRKWVSVEEAGKLIDREGLKKILHDLPFLLKNRDKP
ncbi:MAG: NUDIX hydrolase [Candidatus Aminicenantes bacterium]|nr:NUDIX hydrolase [Candidatus Aminicenantes bacterium]